MGPRANFRQRFTCPERKRGAWGDSVFVGFAIPYERLDAGAANPLEHLQNVDRENRDAASVIGPAWEELTLPL